MNGLRQFPLGDPITGSPHSVCVSLPTMADVIGYEEKDPRVLDTLQTGYPRFIEHPLVRELKDWIRAEQGLGEEPLFLVEGAAALDRLCAFVGQTGHLIEPLGTVHGVGFAEETAAARARAFLQHTGVSVSSRQAEDLLVQRGTRASVFSEETEDAALGGRAGAALAEFLGVPSMNGVTLARSGMNAFFATFQTVREAAARAGRRRWIRLGWLYVDTIRILEAWGGADEGPLVWEDVTDLDGLEAAFGGVSGEVAAIVTEAPTNPLVQTTDLARLRALADRWGCALVVDPSIASAATVAVGEFADVMVTSLTKYAAPAADVMLGAVVPNSGTAWGRTVAAGLDRWITPPYVRDLARLAAQIPGARETLARAQASTPLIAEALEAHPRVKRVWWSCGGEPAAQERFARHLRPGGHCAPVVSFAVGGALANVYDALEMAKTPSFGAAFSMICPFLYLAHYREVTSPEGRARMQAAGLDPELLRLSVGAEPADEIVSALTDALDRLL